MDQLDSKIDPRMDEHDPTLDPQTDAGSEAEELVDEVADDAQQRLWLRAVTASAESLAKLTDATITDQRVQHAVDMAMIAACERIGRLCKSDLEG